MAVRPKILRLPDFDRMPVRVIKTEDPLPPCLPFDRMDQLDMWCDAFEGRIDILIQNTKASFFAHRILQ
ncbi:hypothetical protein EV291_102283 [Rhizobium sp. BK068]|nr:hypothetical protein EV291_102283 [Rhizobium sp. BK068]